MNRPPEQGDKIRMNYGMGREPGYTVKQVNQHPEDFTIVCTCEGHNGIFWVNGFNMDDEGRCRNASGDEITIEARSPQGTLF